MTGLLSSAMYQDLLYVPAHAAVFLVCHIVFRLLFLSTSEQIQRRIELAEEEYKLK